MSNTEFSEPAKASKAFIIWPVALVGACMLIIVIANLGYGVAPKDLMRDPASTFSIPPYAGAISTIGIWVLVATSTIASFTAAVSARHRPLLTSVAALSLLMAMDDAFSLHEYLMAEVMRIPEWVTYGIYSVLFIIVLIRMRNWNTTSSLLLLALTGVAFAASVIVDLTLPTGGLVTVFEDLFKLAGFAFWCSLWCLISLWILRDGR